MSERREDMPDAPAPASRTATGPGDAAPEQAAHDLQATIEDLWARRDGLAPGDEVATEAVHRAIDLLDTGHARVAEIGPDDQVVVHTWLKQAILLLFRLSSMATVELGPFTYADKLALKTGYEALGVRVVPGASARWGAFIDRGVILMPSYVNIGARVGAGTMVDTWATVGSCAQIGSDVHLSGGVGIGGVLEPPQAAPVIVEDETYIGSRSMIVEGARVGRGSVVGAGVILSATIPVIDAATGEELSRGHVPPWCVAVSATRPRSFAGGEYGLPCVLVIKRLEPGVRHDKSTLESVLRDHGATV